MQLLIKFRAAQRLSLLLAAATVLLLISCAQRGGGRIKPVETRIGVVRDVLQKNWDHLETLHGRARLVIESPRQSFSGRALVNVKVPDSVFIKIEAILGLDVGQIFADDKAFLIYSPMEKLAYDGASSDTLNLKMFLGLDLTFPQLMHLISGAALLPELDNAVMQHQQDQLKISGELDGQFYDYFVDVKYGMISKIVLRDAAGQIQLVQEFKRFIKVGSARAPKMIRYTRPQDKESLTLFYDQLTVNKSIAAKEFYIKLPADVFKIRL